MVCVFYELAASECRKFALSRPLAGSFYRLFDVGSVSHTPSVVAVRRHVADVTSERLRHRCFGAGREGRQGHCGVRGRPGVPPLHRHQATAPPQVGIHLQLLRSFALLAKWLENHSVCSKRSFWLCFNLLGDQWRV